MPIEMAIGRSPLSVTRHLDIYPVPECLGMQFLPNSVTLHGKLDPRHMLVSAKIDCHHAGLLSLGFELGQKLIAFLPIVPLLLTAGLAIPHVKALAE